MQLDRHLLFIFNDPPQQGSGSLVIVQRHLQRLSHKNYKISIAATEQSIPQANLPASWQTIPIPLRRWWWLPCRNDIPGLLKLRFRCWEWECAQILQGDRPTVILTLLKGIYPLFAAHLSRSWQIPLCVIVHDQEEFCHVSSTEYNRVKQQVKTVLNQATTIWSVSPELNDAYQVQDLDKAKVLLPIPEGISVNFTQWQESFHIAPVVAYAGSIYQDQLSLFGTIAAALQRVNGTLLLIAPPTQDISDLLNNFSNIKYQEPFPKNADAIGFLAKNASVILVAYPLNFNEYSWVSTCFPSKLVEFAHLGLPLLTLAPPNTALSNWAKKNQWLSHLDRLEEAEFLTFFGQFTQKEMWMKMAEQSRQVALTQFNPELIQSQFEAELPCQ